MANISERMIKIIFIVKNQPFLAFLWPL